MRVLTLGVVILMRTSTTNAAVQTKVVEYQQGDAARGLPGLDDAIQVRGRACWSSTSGPAWAIMPRGGPESWPRWATSPSRPTSTAKAFVPRLPRRRRPGGHL